MSPPARLPPCSPRGSWCRWGAPCRDRPSVNGRARWGTSLRRVLLGWQAPQPCRSRLGSAVQGRDPYAGLYARHSRSPSPLGWRITAGHAPFGGVVRPRRKERFARLTHAARPRLLADLRSASPSAAIQACPGRHVGWYRRPRCLPCVGSPPAGHGAGPSGQPPPGTWPRWGLMNKRHAVCLEVLTIVVWPLSPGEPHDGRALEERTARPGSWGRAYGDAMSRPSCNGCTRSTFLVEVKQIQTTTSGVCRNRLLHRRVGQAQGTASRGVQP
jgi:hypothetical protein